MATAAVTNAADAVDKQSNDGQNAGAANKETDEADEKLFMVDQGFNADDIMNDKLFKMNMSMLEDDSLKEDLSPNPAVPENC